MAENLNTNSIPQQLTKYFLTKTRKRGFVEL
jgi:hypothetical protein